MFLNHHYQYNESVEIIKKQTDPTSSIAGPNGNAGISSGFTYSGYVYYPALFHEPMGRSRCLVLCLAIFECDDHDKEVPIRIGGYDWEQIRPSPPPIGPNFYSESARVDVCHEDLSWWSAVVVHTNHPMYTVVMDGSGEVIVVESNRLRIHLEWRNGEWMYDEHWS